MRPRVAPASSPHGELITIGVLVSLAWFGVTRRRRTISKRKDRAGL